MRPNEYFELGYARGLGKTVVTILKSGTRLTLTFATGRTWNTSTAAARA